MLTPDAGRAPRSGYEAAGVLFAITAASPIHSALDMALRNFREKPLSQVIWL
jgi:hypothetical protein